ncbi:permease [Sphaerisporangium corydalis]|uniref:Permease n=1 Tax=Sphaerisporangium corydalis TaxID=1441875 RepID=A0ABV9EKJ9_9ACTN|nr:permease [Sphaerisporangium corydalis]
MLRLLARRARVQWPLLAALLAVAMVGPALLGTCALLVTRTAEQALEAAVSRAAPKDVDVTAYTVTVRGPDARSVAEDTRGVLVSALAPFAATTATRASSAFRSLPAALAGTDGVQAETYLSGVENLPARTQLTTGHWPRPAPGDTRPAAEPIERPAKRSATEPAARAAASLEAVVFESTARVLGLAVGSRVRIGPELSSQGAPAVDVTVVGVVRPLPSSGWDRDPLAAAGYDLSYQDGRSTGPVHAYGPFVVDLADLLAGGSTIDRMEITAHPDLSAPDLRDLDTAAGAVLGADHRLARVLGDRVKIERVASGLPQTLLSGHDQQEVTAATVLAVAVLGSVLTATALALAGRLTAGVRADETALLTALGFSRGRLAAASAAEAGTLAVLAAALAIPASSALHAGLTHLPPMARAGLAADPSVTGVQVLTVAGGALALAALLVVLAVRPAPEAGERRHRRELLARSGADLLLVAFAAAGWWQLHAQPTGSGSRADVVRVLAPTLLLTAGAALALRIVLPALRGADRLARRARGLVLPLAAFEAARRPQAVAAGLLIGLACAAGTFGIAFDATWQRSQHDQADLSVGTDLALTLTIPPVAGQGAIVSAATGGVVSPAIDRGVAVGQWLGIGGDAPRLVAVDTTHADALLRGRLPAGRDWTKVGAALAPPTRATGVAVPAGAALTLTGTASGATPLTVTPRLLLQDDTGLRTPCIGAPVLLDGKAHPLPACATADGLRLVAVSLPIAGHTTAPESRGIGDPYIADEPLPTGDSHIAVTLTVPTTPPSSSRPEAPASASAGTVPGSSWTATSAAPAPGQLADPAVALTRTPTGTRLRMTTTVSFKGPPDAARNLIATGFPVPGPVPVAVSARFADEVGARPGRQLSLTLGTTAVPITVTEVLPTVPSAPGAAAILADLDTLSRALVVSGNLDFPTDAWWVGHPTQNRPNQGDPTRGDRTQGDPAQGDPAQGDATQGDATQGDAAARATALHLGTVTTRAAETARLTDGPLRAGLPAALRLLVPASVLLLLAGVVLHVTFDLQVRALEVARLRGLGMLRREIRTVLLGQHIGVLLPLLAAGAAVGALATRVVAPLLVRSDTGAVPVPAALPSWPWATEAALLILLPAGCALAVAAVVAVQARRADVAHLRVAS